MPDLPPELHGTPIVIVAGLYAGPADEGEQALTPLQELGTPLFDLSGRAGYAESQSAFDHYFPPGLRYYWKSLFLNHLDDDLIDDVTALAADRPTPQTLFGLRHLGGTIAQVPDDATAYANRRAAFNLSLDAIWDDQANDERVIGWIRRTWAMLRERTDGGVYLNFAGLGEENELLARAGHGGNYERLREIKRRYDPTNLFRGNINIAP